MSGNMTVQLNKNGDRFEGIFTTSAANSKGIVIGVKNQLP